MMKRVVPLMMLALLGGLAPADTPPVCPSSADGVTCSSLSYTILISQKTAQSPDWQPVVTALLKKYPQAHVAELNELSESEIAAALRRGKARHAALIARPEEVNRVLFLNIHRASRQLDDDMWGHHRSLSDLCPANSCGLGTSGDEKTVGDNQCGSYSLRTQLLYH